MGDFIQGATLHSGGGIEVFVNGRFVQLAMGEGRQIESSYTPSDARKLAKQLTQLAALLDARRSPPRNPNGGE